MPYILILRPQAIGQCLHILDPKISKSLKVFQALEIFESISHPKPIRLLGVGVSLLKKEWCQQDLFEKREKKDHLLKAMDRVNERFGDWTLTWASLY